LGGLVIVFARFPRAEARGYRSSDRLRRPAGPVATISLDLARRMTPA
jgi:hypothetical protein